MTTPPTLEEFVQRGFADHAEDAEGVFRRLPEGLPLADSPARLLQLANLATHVAGEHLGRWDEGIALLDRMAAAPAFVATVPEGKGVRRLQAVLHFCAGRTGDAARLLADAHPPGAAPPASTRIRMLTVAASALAFQERPEDAWMTLDEALALAAYRPGREDPAALQLAMAGNNIAATLEQREGRSEAETALMLRAAALGRTWWEVAGDWRNVERAEYRLAMSHLAAGMPMQALRHARDCLRVVEENGPDAGEEFFAREALARGHAAADDPAAAALERDAAAALLPGIGDEGFRAFCAGELAKLDGRLAEGGTPTTSPPG